MRWAVMISVALMLTGCSAANFTSPLPTDGPTMREIMERGESASLPDSLPAPVRHLPQLQDGLYGYTRSVFNELDVLFPRLPNPTIVMYVFPHLSLEDTPIPGYSTMFQLYDRDHFALPGELP